MTQDEFKAQLQTTQDMLTCAINQRTAAQNECVQLGAQIMALQRKVEELQKAAPVLGEVEPALTPPKANGHAEAQAAVN